MNERINNLILNFISFWMSNIELMVFISSRLDEFESDRLVLKDELEKINVKPVIFEDYGARDTSMEEANIEDVRKCHIFIGIYGIKYSEATYKEFKEAIESNKSCLFYFKNYGGGKNPEPDMETFITEIKRQKKIYRKFDNIINLKKIIVQDVMSCISGGFIRDKYEFSDTIGNCIDKIIESSDDYIQFQDFITKYGLKTNIAQIDKTTDELTIIIDKGFTHGLFEKVEFFINKDSEILSKIIVKRIQERMSICIPLEKLPKNFEDDYSKFSLEVINLSKKDFIEKMIWEKLK